MSALDAPKGYLCSDAKSFVARFSAADMHSLSLGTNSLWLLECSGWVPNIAAKRSH
jgi:hypothetical protein